MQFIINAFVKVLKSFGVKFKSEWNSDGTFTIDMYGLSPSLDIILLNLEYDEVIGYDTKYDTETKRNIKTPVVKTVKVFVPYGTHEGRYLRCVMDQDTYAKKINLIEPTLRNYHRDHPITGCNVHVTPY